MNLINKTILPIIIFISAIIVVLNFNNPDLEDFSFTSILNDFRNYSLTSDYENQINKIKNDITAIKSYINHNPLYDTENEDLINQPGIISQLVDNPNFFDSAVSWFKKGFNSLTTYLSSQIANNNNTFITIISSISYYVSGFVPFLISSISLVFDSVSMAFNFIVFAFDIIYI